MRRWSIVVFLLVISATASAQTDEALLSRVRATHKQLQSIMDAIVAYMSDYDAPPKADTIDALAASLQPTYIRELPRADAWGTPFRYQVEGNSYRAASAGADGKFDPSTWKTEWRGSDFNADAVVSDGKFVRAWDPDRGESAARGAAAASSETARQKAIMDALPENERMPYFWKWTTTTDMTSLAAALEKFRAAKKRYPPAISIDELKAALFPDYIDNMPVKDGWGTPFRYTVSPDGATYTLVSAGSDRTFRAESWATAGEFASDAEDAVIRNGKSVRRWKMPS